MLRQLGHLALTSINNGEAIADEIIVHIIAEKIKTLSNDRGWILDGFPATFAQAKLLEKALTGYDVDKPTPERPKKESFLAPNPKPKQEKPKHKSAVDLVVYLNVDDDVAIKRSGGRYCTEYCLLEFLESFWNKNWHFYIFFLSGIYFE